MSDDLKNASINLKHAVNRSCDGDWEATDQAILKAHGYLHRAGEPELADRVMLARGVGATTASARTELREVWQLIEAKDEMQQSMAEADASATFETMGVKQ